MMFVVIIFGTFLLRLSVVYKLGNILNILIIKMVSYINNSGFSVQIVLFSECLPLLAPWHQGQL